ncbi:histidine kinase [Nonomuraea sp. NBC_01738]|uniref:sensor histidine kinase n=1 Tax=Nonomuraea sp. NBC_01738 TaxID=2976003 RepID=UPI002E10C849|nr:histidine kinase [Nonomuraea sp. NBC_01738]
MRWTARPRAARPSRQAMIADVALAVVLTALALLAVARVPVNVQDTEVRETYLVGPLQLRPEPASGSIEPFPADPGPPPRAGGPDADDGPPLPLVALTALPLAVRRRYPLTAFWGVLLAALATYQSATWITVLACAIAAYGAVAHSRDRILAVGGLVVATVLTGFAFRDIAPGLPSWLGPFVVLVSAGAVAGFLQFWRDRLEGVRAAQEEAMRRAVQLERDRIAGELHDVVTHNVSVMVIQAGAARRVMDSAPERSKEALLAVESSGRAAMAELRHVMGLLAAPADGRDDGLEPQPGLDQLGQLAERVRAAGLTVDVEIGPLPGPLPPGVELTAYRVVQEGLTNALKHAEGASATVSIGQAGDRLRIEVADTGGVPGAGSRTGQGRGLIGLRERLAVYGGALDGAPVPGGGYRLVASLPWRDA